MKLLLKNIKINKDGTIIADVDRSALHFARSVTFDKDKEYCASITEAKHKRSLNQNAMLWSLISKIAKETCGDRATAEDEERVYVGLIEKYGISIPAYILPEHLETYVRLNRMVKVYWETDGLLSVRAYPGSSRYTTKEMNALIDGALDEMEELGIVDDEVLEMRETMRHAKY